MIVTISIYLDAMAYHWMEHSTMSSEIRNSFDRFKLYVSEILTTVFIMIKEILFTERGCSPSSGYDTGLRPEMAFIHMQNWLFVHFITKYFINFYYIKNIHIIPVLCSCMYVVKLELFIQTHTLPLLLFK